MTFKKINNSIKSFKLSKTSVYRLKPYFYIKYGTDLNYY